MLIAKVEYLYRYYNIWERDYILFYPDEEKNIF